ncbi:LacI family DNA-binding transcriptional regulator [Lacticaseibacillus saniviri]|uniref:LacI family DNA-binding transcriptional regulator n=1 Tax=Lacticaseibacillus saniviri TaxID=931533 RepID=UPI000704CE25|nr:LacI family DNA-binding transcriptional regulator [Lacticaseibacillus saniviri]MCG4281660.1 LacI family transcriptional regulator [Lacticaseibacillus saniviri]
MKKKVTIREVAERAGISVTTASLILNGKGDRFSEKTRQKVKLAQQDLGYHPDYFAQGLVGQRRNSIGIVIPDILNQFFANFVQSIEQEAIPQGYFPQVFSVNGFHENIDYFIEQFSGGTQKGLILAAPGASQEIVDKVQTSTNVPMVFTDQAEVTKNGDVVLINEAEAGEIIASHLLALGHRRIAIVLPNDMAVNLFKRFSGYQAAFAKYNIPLPEELIFRTSFDPEGGRDVIQKIVQTDATAIIAINDDMAVGVYRGLQAQGKKIPDDYSVVGFDDIPLADFLTPPLTTMAQPINELGKMTVDMVLQRINEPKKAYKTVRLKAKLTVRESTRELKEEKRE